MYILNLIHFISCVYWFLYIGICSSWFNYKCQYTWVFICIGLFEFLSTMVFVCIGQSIQTFVVNILLHMEIAFPKWSWAKVCIMLILVCFLTTYKIDKLKQEQDRKISNNNTTQWLWKLYGVWCRRNNYICYYFYWFASSNL